MIQLEEQLKQLKKEVTIMFALVHLQMHKAHKALMTLDKDLAREIISTEKRINAQELKIDRDCENYIALYSPFAVDLRYILAVLKINNNLERTGDIAEGIARFLLDTESPFDEELLKHARITEMFEKAIEILDDVEQAFENEDTSIARTLFKKDELLNMINRQAAKRMVEYIEQHPENIEQALYILSMIRKLERVGDQAKNMGEEVIFYVEAKVLRHRVKS